MKLYSENEYYKLYQGNMLDMLQVIKPESIDSIVTDPPYGLTSITKRFGKEDSAECQYGKDGSFQRLSKGFMGKEWDGSGIEYNIEAWKNCYKVLKPGGYLLAFGGSRTFHRIAVAIEDAGFEIRDTIMWIYGSGFPKSMALDKSLEAKLTTGSGNKKDFYKCNGTLEESKGKGYTSMKQTNVEQEFRNTNYQSKGQLKLDATTELAKKFKGFGTALKPSFEPIIVARKPFKGSLVDNVIQYGVGGINIDECRVGNEERINKEHGYSNIMIGGCFEKGTEESKEYVVNGRFPANTILTYDDNDFDEVCGGFPDTKCGMAIRHNSGGNTFGGEIKKPPMEDLGYNDSGSACRYFYCAKASKKDRDEGMDEFEEVAGGSYEFRQDGSLDGKIPSRKNTHPTVKPTELMQYLIRLVTPKGGIILDPFNGSGSTGKAAMYENKERNKNYKYIGIELTDEYLPISKARIEAAFKNNIIQEKAKELKEVDENQTTIFDFIN